MRKQTTHTSFELSDMKDYAYMVVTRLNTLIKGTAEPEHVIHGLWNITVSFNNFHFKYRGDLSQYFYYKFDIDLVARIIRDNMIKEIINSLVSDDYNVNVTYGKEY